MWDKKLSPADRGAAAAAAQGTTGSRFCDTHMTPAAAAAHAAAAAKSEKATATATTTARSGPGVGNVQWLG